MTDTMLDATHDARHALIRETDRIADQLERAFSGNAWHGPPLLGVLEGVRAEHAVARPIPAAHSIWELVLHITVWFQTVRGWLDGDKREPTLEEGWPPVGEPTEERWQATLAALRSAHDALLARAATFDDARLDDPTPEHHYTHYVLLHGIVQHTLYHAGQIAILRKGVVR